MNKTDLIDTVAAHLESSKTDAGKAVDAVIEAITNGLKSDHKVTIAGFGTFQRRERAARTGVNPSTGEKMTIAASTTCGFKPSTALKQTL
jgi:DNA-binding protein HU-beta